MTETCPRCGYESPSMSGLGVHWSKIGHEGTPSWKQQTCDWCSEDFEKCNSQITEDGSYCSEECYGKHLSKNNTGENNGHYKGGQQVFICDQCSKQFKEYPANRIENATLCGLECFSDWKRTHGESFYYGSNWEERRKQVIERDDGMCTFEGCNKTKCEDGRDLHVHHIEPFVHFDKEEEANRLENLRTLCAVHHREVEINQ